MSEDTKITLIRADQRNLDYWKDVWRFRGLMCYLAWRDILVRYKQTVMGVLWSIIRPLVTMVVFTFIFGNLAALPSGDVPYPLLVLSALLPWQLFSSAIMGVGESLTANANLVQKVYFPRVIAPFSSIVVGLVDFCIALLILAAVMAFYGVLPGWQILTLPVFIILAVLPALGVGLFLATLNVKYRDFRFIIPFMIQTGLYISPVGFSSDIVPDDWRLLYSINPMVGVIDGFRWAVTGGDLDIYMPGFLLSVGLSILSVIIGLRFFINREKYFADMI